MNNSPVNFTTPETFTNSSTRLFELMDYLEIFVYSINLFGFPTHSYIIWLIVMKTGSGVASEIFILNLSVCEIAICLNAVIFILSWWCEILKILDSFLVGLIVTGRPLFQCLICVERYLAVVHPVIFLKSKPLRYRVICCTVAWIIILGSCLVCTYNLYLKHTRTHSWLMSIQFTLLISIQLFCLVAVLRALKQSGPGDRRRDEENNMKRRAFYLILITAVTMIVLYLPSAITNVSIIVTAESTQTVWFTSWTCFILAGFVQPFLYLHRAGKLSCLCSS